MLSGLRANGPEPQDNQKQCRPYSVPRDPVKRLKPAIEPMKSGIDLGILDDLGAVGVVHARNTVLDTWKRATQAKRDSRPLPAIRASPN